MVQGRFIAPSTSTSPSNIHHGTSGLAGCNAKAPRATSLHRLEVVNHMLMWHRLPNQISCNDGIKLWTSRSDGTSASWNMIRISIPKLDCQSTWSILVSLFQLLVMKVSTLQISLRPSSHTSFLQRRKASSKSSKPRGFRGSGSCCRLIVISTSLWKDVRKNLSEQMRLKRTISTSKKKRPKTCSDLKSQYNTPNHKNKNVLQNAKRLIILKSNSTSKNHL